MASGPAGLLAASLAVGESKKGTEWSNSEVVQLLAKKQCRRKSAKAVKRASATATSRRVSIPVSIQQNFCCAASKFVSCEMFAELT